MPRLSLDRSSPRLLTRRSLIGVLCATTATLGARPSTVFASGTVILASAETGIHAAFEKWARLGGELVIDQDFTIERPLIVSLERGRSYSLTTLGNRKLRYAGPQFHWAVCLLSRGATPLEIRGPLEIDGADRVCMPLFVRFEGVSSSDRRDCTISGLTCRNARMIAGRSRIDGSATNAYGATGMMLMGGFDRLLLRDVAATNVTRAAGASRLGSQGCAGIAVVGQLGSTASARHVTIERFAIERVDSDDPVGSKARADMDGLLVFQSAERGGSAPIVRDGHIVNAAGRAIKIFAPGGGGLTQRIEVERSVAGPSQGAVEIAHQHGDGTIADIMVSYSGNAHAGPTQVIGLGTNAPRSPGFAMGAALVSNITVRDTTRVPKRALIAMQQFNPQDREARSYRIENVVDEGTSEYFFLPGSLGEYGPASLRIRGARCNLRTALFASEDRNRALRIDIADSTFGRGNPVPTKVMYDRRPVAPALRVDIDMSGTVDGLRRGT